MQAEQGPAYALKSSSSLDIGDRLFPSGMMRNFGTELGTPSQKIDDTLTNSHEQSTSQRVPIQKTTNIVTDSNEQSTSQSMRASSPKTSENTQKPSTSQPVHVTSPLLIPVNKVTTVKVSPKSFLSSDESTSTSSSSSSSSATSETHTGSSNG